MSSPCHYLMSPRRCISDGSAIALSAASASQRYPSVNPAPIRDYVDHVSVDHVTIETTAGDQQTRDATAGYILHPAYGWLPEGTPYLALLAARMVS